MKTRTSNSIMVNASMKDVRKVLEEYRAKACLNDSELVYMIEEVEDLIPNLEYLECFYVFGVNRAGDYETRRAWEVVDDGEEAYSSDRVIFDGWASTTTRGFGYVLIISRNENGTFCWHDTTHRWGENADMW